jgi:hypothetical protein
MLIHFSIAAREPQHVASVIAELWGEPIASACTMNVPPCIKTGQLTT